MSHIQIVLAMRIVHYIYHQASLTNNTTVIYIENYCLEQQRHSQLALHSGYYITRGVIYMIIHQTSR